MDRKRGISLFHPLKGCEAKLAERWLGYDLYISWVPRNSSLWAHLQQPCRSGGTARVHCPQCGSGTAMSPYHSEKTAVVQVASGVIARLILSPPPLFGREHFQTSRPPTAQDCLDEFFRQSLGPHFRGEPLVVIFDGDELRLWGKPSVAVRRTSVQHREPHVRSSIILRPPQHADIYELPAGRQLSPPLDAGMRRADHVGGVLLSQMVKKMCGSR